MKTRHMGAIPTSAILSRKGIARYGGVSRTGPLSWSHVEWGGCSSQSIVGNWPCAREGPPLKKGTPPDCAQSRHENLWGLCKNWLEKNSINIHFSQVQKNTNIKIYPETPQLGSHPKNSLCVGSFLEVKEAPTHKEFGLSNLSAGGPFAFLCGYSLCVFSLRIFRPDVPRTFLTTFTWQIA